MGVGRVDVATAQVKGWSWWGVGLVEPCVGIAGGRGIEGSALRDTQALPGSELRRARHLLDSWEAEREREKDQRGGEVRIGEKNFKQRLIS